MPQLTKKKRRKKKRETSCLRWSVLGPPRRWLSAQQAQRPSRPTPLLRNGPSYKTKLRGRQMPTSLHNPFLRRAISATAIHGFVSVRLAEKQNEGLTPSPAPGQAGTGPTCWVTRALTPGCFAVTSFKAFRYFQSHSPAAWVFAVVWFGFFFSFKVSSPLLSIQIYSLLAASLLYIRVFFIPAILLLFHCVLFLH